MRSAQNNFRAKTSFGLAQDYDISGLLGRLLGSDEPSERVQTEEEVIYFRKSRFGGDTHGRNGAQSGTLDNEQQHERNQRYND